MRENLGLQVALILFTTLTVVLSVSTFFYFHRYTTQQQRAEKTAAQLSEVRAHEQLLAAQLQAVKRVVTEREAATAADIQDIHGRDVRRVQADTSVRLRPTYQRLIDHTLSALAGAAEREQRARSDLLAVREDLSARTDQHNQEIAIHQSAAQQRENEFARQRGEDDAQRQEMSARIERLSGMAQRQSGELAESRVEFDRMHSSFTLQLEKTNLQYGIVRDRWEKTQVDAFEQPDGHITYANARTGIVHVDLGRADGLRRGVAFRVFDYDTQGVVGENEKGTIEITRVTGVHSAEARVTQDSLSNPVLKEDLIFTPLWQSGVQREFCLLGILDIDGDGKDDGATVRNLMQRQNAVVLAEVDAQGRPRGELTAAARYVVVGARPRVTDDDAPKDAYDRMLSRAVELGIDQISLDKLLDYLNHRPTRVVRARDSQASSMFAPARIPTHARRAGARFARSPRTRTALSRALAAQRLLRRFVRLIAQMKQARSQPVQSPLLA